MKIVTAKPKMKATDIVPLLAAQHSNDVFITECKGGPTWGGEHDRMDAWAMRKSWSRPLTTAYEIKVSRQDFLNDKKWHAYLAYCNEFYFVCPPGIIRDDELPPEAGLWYVASTGSKLFKKKQAARREVAIPDELYRYILMSRVRIKVDGDEPKAKDAAYWREWLAKKEEDRDIGWQVSKTTAEYVSKIERENSQLKSSIETLKMFRDRLAEMGIDGSERYYDWQVRDALAKLKGEIPEWMPDAINEMERAAKKLRELIGK